MNTTVLRQCLIMLTAAATITLWCSAAGAQNLSADDRVALAGPWRGLWNSDTYEYQAVMTLVVNVDGRVEGKIDWTLRRSNRPDHQRKIGQKGVEYVRGKFLPNARVVSVDGYRLDDPNSVLGVDKYRLVFSENRQTLGGITWDHGTWGGRIFLRAVTRISAASTQQRETVRDFLAKCAGDTNAKSACSDEVAGFVLMMTLRASPVCSGDAPTETLVVSVVRWLNAHPETHSMRAEDGMSKAFNALYPCRR